MSVYNKYEITQKLIPGLPKDPYADGIGKYRGIVMHATAVYQDQAIGERNYEAGGAWQNAFVGFFTDADVTIQCADINYKQWHACSNGNKFYVGSELCQSHDHTIAMKAYDRWVWLAARTLFDRKLGVIDNVTIRSHAQVTAQWHESTHTDPCGADGKSGYLSEHGIVWEQVVQDVKKYYDAMMAESGSAAPNPNVKPTLSIGSTGEAVVELQLDLMKLGFDPKGADGKFGNNTKSALEGFQKAHGLTVDGMCGQTTWNAITLALTPAKFAVYQYANKLKEFVDENEAIAEAKKWNNSHVEEIATHKWVWDNYPMLRIRKEWNDAKSQIGAFKNIDSAKALADKNPGYKVFDEQGNVVYESKQATPVPEHLYHVRKDWADAKSQIGAYKNLESAKSLADQNEGYKVFDENGNIIYTPAVKTAVQTSQPVQQPVNPKPVIQAEQIVKHPILGQSKIDENAITAFIQKQNPKFDENIAKAFIEIGNKYGVCGDIAICQSIIETHYFMFDDGTAVKPEQHNYAGIGVTQKGEVGNSFADTSDGVTAQMQHLFAYASKENLPNGEVKLDPRFDLVARGIAPNWEDLDDRWATGANYGEKIMSLYSQLTDFAKTYVAPVKNEVKAIHEVIVTVDLLNVRDGSDKSANVINQIERGTVLIVEDIINNWIKTTINDKTGYVMKDFVLDYDLSYLNKITQGGNG